MAFNYNGNKIYVGAEFDEQKLRTQFDGAIKSLSNDKSKLIKVNVDGKEAFKVIRQYMNEVDELNGKVKQTILTSEQFVGADGKAIAVRNKLTGQFEKSAETITQIDTVTKKASKSTNAYSESAKNASKNVKDLGVGLTNFWGTMRKIAEFQVINKVLDFFTTAMTEAITVTKDFDDALTNLRKVSDLDGDALQEYTDKLAELGETVGRTRIQMTENATIMKQGGFSDADALTLSKIASLYQNVADSEVSAGEASSFVISQMKAYNIEASDAETIVDRLNAVSNNFAVSNTDLATGLTKSSAALSALGNDMNESIAMITAGSEIMTGQASTVAKGLQTIGINIQKIAQKSKTLEYTVNGATTSVNLFNEAGEQLSTYDVLKEISADWKKMNASEQGALASALAGKTRFNVFTSVLGNFDDAIKACDTSMNSLGSAEEENAKKLESLDSKFNMMVGAFQELILGDTSLNTLLKLFVDLGTQILKLANNDFVKLLAVTTLTVAGIVELLGSVNKLNIAFKGFPNVGKTFVDILGIMLDMARKGEGAMAGLIESIGALSVAEKTSLILTAGAIIAVGIYAIVKAVDHFNVSQKEAIDLAKEAQSTLKDTQGELSSVKDRLKEVKDEIEQINSKGGLTLTDEAKINQLKRETTELNLQKKILEQKEKIQKQALQSNINSALGKKSSYDEYIGGGVKKDNPNVGQKFISHKGTLSDQIESDTKSYQAVTHDIEELNKVYESLLEKQANHQELTVGESYIIADYDYNLQRLTDTQNKYASSIDENTDTIMDWYNQYADMGVEFDKMPQKLQDAINALSIETAMMSENSVAIKDETSLLEAYGNETHTTVSNMDELKEAVERSGKSWDDVKEAIDNGEYIKAFGIACADTTTTVSDLEDELSDVSSLSEEISDSFSSLSSAYDTLSSAQQEFAENGAISANTLSKLLELEPQYLQYLTDEGGQIGFNEQGLIDLANARKQDYIATIQESASKDMMAIAEGNLEQASAGAQQAVANAGNSAEKAGNQADIASGQIQKLAVAFNNARKASNGDEVKLKQLNAVHNYYKKVISTINSFNVSLGKNTSATKKNTSARKQNVDATKEQTNALKEQEQAIQKEIDKYEKVIAYIKKKVNDYIDTLNKQKDAELDAIDVKIKALQDAQDARDNWYDNEIDKLEDAKDKEEEYWDAQIDAIKKQNDELEDQIKLQQLLDALNSARAKRLKVYKEGEGFVYTQDNQAIKEAQDKLDEFNREQALNKEIADLEANRDAKLAIYEREIQALKDKQKAEKDSYDKQIQDLENYKNAVEARWDAQIKYYQDWLEQFGNQVNAYEDEQNRLLALELTGIDFENKNWTTRLGNLTNFVNSYIAKLQELARVQAQMNMLNTSAPAPALSGGGGGGSSSASAPNTAQQHRNYWKVVVNGKETASNYASINSAQQAGQRYKKQGYSSIGYRMVRFATGSSSIADDQVALVGDNPNNNELVIGSKLNGTMMNLKKGSGVVNAQSTNTLAGILNTIGNRVNLGGAIGNLSNSTTNDVIHIDTVNIDGAQIRDVDTFSSALRNMKGEAIQKAYRH